MTVFLAAVCAALSTAAPASIQTLKVEPTIDGDLRDWSGTQLKLPDGAKSKSATLTTKLGTRGDALFIGVSFTDDALLRDDLLDVTLYFPNTGPLAQGFTYRFAIDGAKPSPTNATPPPFALKLATFKSKVEQGKVWTLEAKLPIRALPRFPAAAPMLLSVCVDVLDVDAKTGDTAEMNDKAAPTRVTTCPTGELPDGPVKLSDDVRKSVTGNATLNADFIEARDDAWVALGRSRAPVWVRADQPMTRALLTAWLPDTPVTPETVALPIPPSFSTDLAEIGTLYPFVYGANPFVKEGECKRENELRMILYAVKGNEARHVLDWPVATCTLGRAMQYELKEDTLLIGYTNGATHHFAWSKDHYERSELGTLFKVLPRSTL